LNDADSQNCACAEHICSYGDSDYIFVFKEVDGNDERICQYPYDTCQNTENVECSEKSLLEPFLDDQKLVSLPGANSSH
jgi:hypothetical protein